MIRFIIVAILIELMFGCKRNVGQEQKIVFSGYYIPVEGGHIDMKLDSITPLTDLIPQLRSNNRLYETGKGYWIGYNDLMFSIAVYSDKAIKPLGDFIDTTTNYDSKVAAIYTLHLIGIKCRVAGRTYEEFTNIKAREALFKILAKHDTLQPQIISLIIRDPRESDIPNLFNILDSLKSDCWALTSGLLRYDLREIPVAQDVPESMIVKSINLANHTNFPDNETIKNVLTQFSHKFSDFVIVDDTLFKYNFKMPVRIGINNTEVSLAYLIMLCRLTDYSFIGPNFQYFYKDGKINFFSAHKTKHLWLDWWNSQSPLYRDSLENSYKKIRARSNYN